MIHCSLFSKKHRNTYYLLTACYRLLLLTIDCYILFTVIPEESRGAGSSNDGKGKGPGKGGGKGPYNGDGPAKGKGKGKDDAEDVSTDIGHK